MDELNVVDATQEQVVDVPIEQTEVVEVETEVAESEDTETATVEPVEVEKPKQSPEDNSKFAEIRRKYEAETATAVTAAKQEAKDTLIAKQFGKSHGIYTEEAYDAALAKEESRKQVEAIKNDTNYTDNEAREIYEARQIKAEREVAQVEAQRNVNQKEQQARDNNDFLDYFEKINKRPYNPKSDELPPEIFESVAKGTPIKYAFMEYNESKRLEAGAVKSKNQENLVASVGSVKGDGVVDSPLTADQIENMSTNELMARWDEVRKVSHMI